MLQSFLTAATAAAMPAGPLLDSFGNPLCITGVPHGSNHDGHAGDDHSGLPHCCVLGCSFAQKTPPAPPPAGMAAIRPSPQDGPRARLRRNRRPTSRRRAPGNPRAPPLKG